MSINPRLTARLERAKLTPAGVPAEKAAPLKASEPAAPIQPAPELASVPKARRRAAPEGHR